MKIKIITFFFRSMMIFGCFGMVANIIYKLEEYKVAKNGKSIEVVINKIPEKCNQFTKARKDFEFVYKGKIHSKWVGYDICTKNVGNKIMLIHWDDKENIFLYPEEDIQSDILSFALLFVISLVALIISFRIKGIFPARAQL
jgi:hypothetical protein